MGGASTWRYASLRRSVELAGKGELNLPRGRVMPLDQVRIVAVMIRTASASPAGRRGCSRAPCLLDNLALRSRI